MGKHLNKIIAAALMCTTLFSVIACLNITNREELIVASNYENELKALTLNKFYKHKKETQAIIDAHKNDFTSKDVKKVLKDKGGYKAYVRSLGGVFEKYVDFKGTITTYSELAEVADYVWGLYDIWGVDYSNGCGYEAKHQYNYDNGGASRFYREIEPKKRFHVNYCCYEFDNDSSFPGVDEMLANPDKYYAITNCDMGVCQLFKKAGLIPKNMPGPGEYAGDYKSAGYNYTIIRKASDLRPGDVIMVARSNSKNVDSIKTLTNWMDGFFHTIVVGERDDKAGTITYYDSGHKYTRKGTYRSIRKLGDPEVYPGHTKWIGVRYSFTKNLIDDTNDKKAPELTVKYSITKSTNQNVTVTIESKEKVKAVKGWNLSKDGLRLVKTFEKNTTETVDVLDLANNKTSVTVKVGNIDKKAPKITVAYDNTGPTNKDVVVTIKSDEKINAVKGCTLSQDKLSLTKIYEKNVTEKITISDLVGNTSTAEIKIANIDKEAPGISVEYDNTGPTNKDVTVLIKASEYIKAPEGWDLLSDKTSIRKTYSANSSEIITVSDMVGNTSTADIDIKNIDKESPKLDVNYSTIEPTNKNVIVTIKSNESIAEIPEGWYSNSEGTTISKEYDKNSKESIVLSDMVGNKAAVYVEVNNIYETKIEETQYKVEDDTIIVSNCGETVQEFMKNNTMTAQSIKVFNSSDEEITDETIIGTGSKIVLDEAKTYIIIVQGDSSGNGKTGISELAKARKKMFQKVDKDDIYLRALDYNENGRIDILDMSNIYKALMEQ